MIEFLTESPAGVQLRIDASPGSRRNEIGGWHEGALKVAVTQIPEQGKANKAILKLLAKELGLKKSQVTLTSGETSRKKTILVTQISVADLSERISKSTQ